MDANNQNLIADAFYHLDILKTDLTRQKILHNRDREFVDTIDKLLSHCELIQLLLKSYDSLNFRLLCNIVNSSFMNPNCHGVTIIIPKKRLANNLDKGKMDYITFPS